MTSSPLPYRIYIYRDGVERDVTTAVAVMFDVIVGSLDYGSGFLSTEEITELRRVGAAMGAEPLHYQCKFLWRQGCSDFDPANDKCECGAYDEVTE